MFASVSFQKMNVIVFDVWWVYPITGVLNPHEPSDGAVFLNTHLELSHPVCKTITYPYFIVSVSNVYLGSQHSEVLIIYVLFMYYLTCMFRSASENSMNVSSAIMVNFQDRGQNENFAYGNKVSVVRIAFNVFNFLVFKWKGIFFHLLNSRKW